ncbi:MAG: hypothetical protein PHW04_17150 [Candidatus Wallbacteria bacterium]|nr:hypothetical protein [Candidatus Wallbacteria bacterium]
MNNRLKIIFIAILFSFGLYFFIKQVLATRGGTFNTSQTLVVQVPAPQDRINQKPIEQPISQTQEVAATPPNSQTTEVVATSEVDMTKIVWSRDYLKKYQGKIDNSILIMLNDLLKTGKDKGWKDYTKFCEYMANHNDSALADLLLEISKDLTVDSGIRGFLLNYIVSPDRPEAVKLIADLTNSSIDQPVRQEAIKTLGFLGGKNEIAKKRLLEISNDPKDEKRDLAISFLRNYASDESRKTIYSILEDKNASGESQLAAIYALSSHTGEKERSIELLKRIFYDMSNSGMIRGHALKSLSVIDRDVTLPILEKCLESEEDGVAQMLAIQLSDKFRNPRVIDLLLAILLKSEQNFSVSTAAAVLSVDTKEQAVLDKVLENYQLMRGWNAFNALDLIKKFGSKKAIPILRDRLGNPKDDLGIKNEITKTINYLEDLR